MQAFVDRSFNSEDTSASHSYAGNVLYFENWTDNTSYYSPKMFMHGLRIIQGQALYTNSFTVSTSYIQLNIFFL